MVDIKAIIDVLNGVEENLKDQLRNNSDIGRIETIADALTLVQRSITKLLQVG